MSNGRAGPGQAVNRRPAAQLGPGGRAGPAGWAGRAGPAGQALGFFNYKPKWLYKEGRGEDSNPSPHGFILKALTN